MAKDIKCSEETDIRQGRNNYAEVENELSPMTTLAYCLERICRSQCKEEIPK